MPRFTKMEFPGLYREFLDSGYLETLEGMRHLDAYEEGREKGRLNYRSVLEARERGEDVTDLVLRKLLPHNDTAANRERGAWVHIAPAIQKDIKTKYEGAGWTKPEDWPAIAQAILDLLHWCNEDPELLSEACAEFAQLPYSKGFQTGILTPILNALRPEDYLLINLKSRQTINYFSGESYGLKLTDYPGINGAGHRLIEEFTDEMDQPDAPALSDADRFDMFSHWLVAERKYPFPDKRYWKVAPGEKGWQWEECRENGFIGIGWNDAGDVSGLSRAEFDILQDKMEAERGYKKEATNQVWTFAHDIQEGDVIVANRGTSEILGFGTVVGPYEFVPDAHYAHQFPVRWNDTVPRRVNEKGWRRTLIEIKPEEKFEELRAAPPLDGARRPEIEEAGPIESERSYWWVNQGETYSRERDGGYLWASKESKGGRVLGHHAELLRVRVGDVVFHYASGKLRAVSEVLKPAEGAPRPSEPWDADGHLVRVRYHELSTPVPLGEISLEARVAEGGPFTQHGTVKQGYFFPVASEFVLKLATDFPGRFPGSLMPPPKRKRVWLFQANPEQWDLEEHVRTARTGDEDDWTVSRFREEMRSGDTVILWQGGPHAGVYAIGELVGEPFERELPPWRPPKKDGSKMEWAMRYSYERVLPRPVLKHELLEDPVLKDLQVLRAPQGTNFKVTEKEWSALQALLDRPEGHDYHEPSWKEIASAIFVQGMRIEERDLRRYHLALKSRGFVILSGVSGTGKTWLTEAYARAVGAECLVVPVAPNWTTNEDLLGYFNPLDGEYHDTRFSRFLRNAASEYKRAQAERRRPKPYHLVLDEMNLARVEYYFAKFLSALEVRVRYGTATIELGPHEEVLLPPNLRFAGTVNVDETTHGFADKVYDRAQLIELQLRRDFLLEHLRDAPYREVLMGAWDVAHSVAPFAFRVLDDIQAYVRLAEELEVPWEEALDEQLMQKVLPKLKGADLRVGETLERLVELTAEDLPLSHAKATKMLDDFRQHGFTSFF